MDRTIPGLQNPIKHDWADENPIMDKIVDNIDFLVKFLAFLILYTKQAIFMENNAIKITNKIKTGKDIPKINILLV